jgi:hypothetical protein
LPAWNIDCMGKIFHQVSRLSEFSQLARDNKTVCDPLEADRLRTMILSMVDVRVVLIKLADRLHNMRTLAALSFRKQLQIANETLEIFAPLANRLGVWSWKAELEDLCFKHLKPDEHKELATRLFSCCREGIVMSSIHQLDEALRSHGVQFTDLSGRPKNLYSIYKKMTRCACCCLSVYSHKNRSFYLRSYLCVVEVIVCCEDVCPAGFSTCAPHFAERDEASRKYLMSEGCALLFRMRKVVMML